MQSAARLIVTCHCRKLKLSLATKCQALKVQTWPVYPHFAFVLGKKSLICSRSEAYKTVSRLSEGNLPRELGLVHVQFFSMFVLFGLQALVAKPTAIISPLTCWVHDGLIDGEEFPSQKPPYLRVKCSEWGHPNVHRQKDVLHRPLDLGNLWQLQAACEL